MGNHHAKKRWDLGKIMAQSGLPHPSDPGSRGYLQVFADIEMNNRSSRVVDFSSHMTNIVSILNQVDTAPWTLLDELGEPILKRGWPLLLLS